MAFQQAFNSKPSPEKKSINRFGDDLWRSAFGSGDLSLLQDGKFISPFSVALLMAMALNGTEGQTHQEILRLFDSTSSAGNLNLRIQQLSLALRGSVEVANSVWIKNAPSVVINPNFHHVLQVYYDAEILPMTTAEAINQWCSTKTKGLIPHIIHSIHHKMLFVLVNAIYFKGTWKYPFERHLTKPTPFAVMQSLGNLCEMMELDVKGDKKLQYTETGTYQAIKLPYDKKTPNLYAIVVLPRQGCHDVVLKGSFETQNFIQIINRAAPQYGTLRLPKFRLETSLPDIADNLQQIGVHRLFGHDAELQPTFSSTVPLGSHVDQIIHKTVVEVNEEGTEAAAITAVAAFGSSSPQFNLFDMTCDRPFLFAVFMEATPGDALILFQGVVRNPSGKPLQPLQQLATSQLSLQTSNPFGQTPSPFRDAFTFPKSTSANTSGQISNTSHPTSIFSNQTATWSLNPTNKEASQAKSSWSFKTDHLSGAAGGRGDDGRLLTFPKPTDEQAPAHHHAGLGSSSIAPTAQLFQGKLDFLHGVNPSVRHRLMDVSKSTIDGNVLTSIFNLEVVPLLEKASKAVAERRRCDQQLSEAYHGCRVLTQLWLQVEGEPFASGNYNLACALSLMIESQLEVCRASQSNAEVVSLADLATTHVYTPTVTLRKSHGLVCDATVPPFTGNLLIEVLHHRLEACNKFLKVAVAAGFDNMDHIQKDRDLKALKELKQ